MQSVGRSIGNVPISDPVWDANVTSRLSEMSGQKPSAFAPRIPFSSPPVAAK